MKKSKLPVTAVAAIAIGAPIAGFVREMKRQSVTSTVVGLPFLHGFPNGQIGGQTELTSLELANEWLNSPPWRPLRSHSDRIVN